MTGTVAGLDVSSDGSRVLVGKAVSTDAKGNTYYDLFMHVGNSPNSVQVADTTNGVLFNGMTADGSKVFFTTADQLTGDTDTSADLYRADVTSSTRDGLPGSRREPASGNTDACDPVPGKEGPHWNVIPGGRKLRRRRARRRRGCVVRRRHGLLPLARETRRVRDAQRTEPLRRPAGIGARTSWPRSSPPASRAPRGQ